MEKIGLEAVFYDENFQAGVARYEATIARALQSTSRATADMTGNVERSAGSLNIATGAMMIALGNLAVQATSAVFGAIRSAGEAIRDFAADSVLAAARVQELKVVMGLLGHAAGYSDEQLASYVQRIRDLGIRTDEAINLVIQFTRYNLDLEKAVQLARVAQDAAVISMKDSSETLSGLLHGILTFNPRVVRTYGILAEFGREFDNVAKGMGTTRSELSSVAKVQIALDAVLSEGQRIAGTYSAAMGTAGKQARSTARYIYELAVTLGTPFLDAYSKAVFGVNTWLGVIRQSISEGGRYHTVLQGLGEVASRLAATFVGVLFEGTRRAFDAIDTLAQVVSSYGIPVLTAFASVIVYQVVGALGTFITSIGAATAALRAFVASAAIAGGPVTALAAFVGGLTLVIQRQVEAEREHERQVRQMAAGWESVATAAGGYRDQVMSLAYALESRLNAAMTDDLYAAQRMEEEINDIRDEIERLVKDAVLLGDTYSDVGAQMLRFSKTSVGGWSDVGAAARDGTEAVLRGLDAWGSRMVAMQQAFENQVVATENMWDDITKVISNAYAEMVSVAAGGEAKIAESQAKYAEEAMYAERVYRYQRALLVAAGNEKEVKELDTKYAYESAKRKWEHERELLDEKIKNTKKLAEIRDHLLAKTLVTMAMEYNLTLAETQEVARRTGILQDIAIQEFLFSRGIAEAKVGLLQKLGESNREYTQRVIQYAAMQTQALMSPYGALQQLQAAWDALANQQPIAPFTPPPLPSMPAAGGGGTPVSPVEPLEDTVNKMANAIRSAIDTIAALVKWSETEAGVVRAKATHLASLINEIIVAIIHAAWEFGDATRDWRDIPKAAAEFAGWVSDTMSAVSAAVGALGALATFTEVPVDTVNRFTGNLDMLLKQVLSLFVSYSSREKEWLSEAAVWSDDVKAVMAMLGDAASTITAVAEGKQVDTGRVDIFLGNLKYLLDRFLQQFGGHLGDWYSTIAEWVHRVKDVLSMLGEASDAITAVAEGKQVSAKRVDIFLGNLYYVLTRFGTRFGALPEDWYSTIAEWVGRVKDALSMLGDASEVITTIAGGKQVSAKRVDTFLGNLYYVLTRFGTRFKDIDSDWYSRIAQWTSNVSPAVNLMEDVIKVLADMAGTAAIPTDRINSLINNTYALLVGFSSKFGGIGPGWYSVIARWTGNARAAVDLVTAAISTISSLAEMPSVGVGKISVAVNEIYQVLVAFATKFGSIGPGWYSVIAQWTGNVKSALDMINNAAGTLSSIAEAMYPSLGQVYKFIDSLMSLLSAFSTKFGGIGPKWYSVIVQWTGNVKAALEMVTTATTALSAVAETPVVNSDKVQQFIDNLWSLLSAFSKKFGVIGPKWYSVIVQWVGNAKAALDMVHTAASALSAVMETPVVNPDKVQQFIDALWSLLSAFSKKFGVIGPNWYSVIVQWVGNVKAAMDLVKTAAEAVAAVVDTPHLDSDAVNQFVDDMWLLLSKFSEQFGDIGSDWYSTIAEWAGNVTAALDLVKATVDALSAVGKYTPIGNLDAVLTGFVVDVDKLILFMVSLALHILSSESMETLRLASEFASSVRQVVDLVGSAVDAVVKLGEFVPPEDVGVMDTLIQYIDLMVSGVSELAARVSLDAVAAGAEFSRGAVEVFAAVSAGVSTLADVAAFGTEYLSPQKFMVLFDILGFTLDGFAWMASRVAPSMAIASAIASAYLQQVWGALTTGLRFLSALAEAALPTRDKIDTFVDTLEYILSRLGAGLDLSDEIANTWGDIVRNLSLGGIDFPTYRMPEIRIPTPTIDWSGITGVPRYTGGGGGGGGGSGGGDVSLSRIGKDAADTLFDTLSRAVTIPLITALESAMFPAAYPERPQYQLVIYSQARIEQLVQDFALLRAMAT